MLSDHIHYDRIRNYLALMYRGTNIKFDYLHYKVSVTFTDQGVFQVYIEEADTRESFQRDFTSLKDAIDYILV